MSEESVGTWLLGCYGYTHAVHCSLLVLPLFDDVRVTLCVLERDPVLACLHGLRLGKDEL